MPILSKLNEQEETALKSVANSLGVSRDSLYALIDFESGWKPGATNSISGARGLIQFMPATARKMGFESPTELIDKYPDRISQLYGPVYRYLKSHAPFTKSPADLFMAVFYPAARKWNPATAFPAIVQNQNPGITTPADYTRKVFTKSGMAYLGPAAVLVVFAGLLAFLILK